MTPQETALVNELFNRLAALENAPRDPGAERLIAAGLQRAPHALYVLVQTALVQDEALKRANARIEELQAQTNGAPASEAERASFLDNMRAAFAGGGPRGSVPSVHATQPAPSSYSTAPYPPQGPVGSGGSFLGTAASTAAGVIGGSLLLNGIRSMFGPHFGGHEPSPFGTFADRTAPSGNTSGSAADSDLARDAGIDDIGHAAHNSRVDEDDPAADSFTNSITDDDDLDDDDLDGDDFGDVGPGDDNVDV